MKKLKLKHDTIRQLRAIDLNLVGGGGGTPKTDIKDCWPDPPFARKN